ncbi:MAG: hypothetical protein Q9195_008431 [Heterodermia aff. obscurata]
MTLFLLPETLGILLALAAYTVAQLTGSLQYDGEQTMVVTIENPTAKNMTMIGSNDLFDRINLVPFAPFTLTNITGSPVTLNVTRYQVPPLSDEAFSDIIPGGTWSRALNISNYLLGPLPGMTTQTKSECFVASLAPSYYGLDTTDFDPGETLANYYLTKGLISVKVKSAPLHFNYTVPVDFTNDQAAYIKADATIQRLQTDGGSITAS